MTRIGEFFYDCALLLWVFCCACCIGYGVYRGGMAVVEAMR